MLWENKPILQTNTSKTNTNRKTYHVQTLLPTKSFRSSKQQQKKLWTGNTNKQTHTHKTRWNGREKSYWSKSLNISWIFPQRIKDLLKGTKEKLPETPADRKSPEQKATIIHNWESGVKIEAKGVCCFYGQLPWPLQNNQDQLGARSADVLKMFGS